MAVTVVVSVDEVKRFIVRCMIAVGTPEVSAELIAEVLTIADYRGHFSHGLNRLDMYVNDVANGNYDVTAEPRILKETPGTAFVDGGNGIGMVTGSFCMELAIKKAKENGIAWVTCTGSNHYGIAGYYSLMAVKQGLIGMSFTNTSPQVIPTRAKEKAIGTNPISFGAPAKQDDYFMLDMATSTVAYGKVEVKRSTGTPIPSGWILDSEGKTTTDPSAVVEGGLLPLGGEELTSGYKGYGLATMVDTICGVLSGGPSAQHVRKYRASGAVANLGQTFVALNPDCFAAGFEGSLQVFMDEMRQLNPCDSSNPVKVAGDLSRERMSIVDMQGGISYHMNYIASLRKLADRLKVEPIKPID